MLQELGDADAVLRVMGVQNTKFVSRTIVWSEKPS